MSKIISIWCEWDICQEGQTFKTEAAANKWLHHNLVLMELAIEDYPHQHIDETIEEMKKDGLIVFEYNDLT